MKVEITAPPADPPVTVELTMSGDEAFYLYVLAYTKSNGTSRGLRNKFESGAVNELGIRLAQASGVYKKAIRIVQNGHNPRDTVAERANAALAEARS